MAIPIVADGNGLEAVGAWVTTAELRRVQGHNLVAWVVVDTTRAETNSIVCCLTVETLLVLVHVLRAFANVVMMGPDVQIMTVVRGNDSEKRRSAESKRVESQHFNECAESECGR